MQDLELELISDPEMYRMIQPNIRAASAMRAVAMHVPTTSTWERSTPQRAQSHLSYISTRPISMAMQCRRNCPLATLSG